MILSHLSSGSFINNCWQNSNCASVLNHQKIIVSATRRRRDNKIPLCQSAPVFNIVINDHGRTHKWEFSVFNRKFFFGANLVKKIKLVSLSWNLVPELIQICKIQSMMFIFSVFDRKHPFWANLVQEIKIVSLS